MLPENAQLPDEGLEGVAVACDEDVQAAGWVLEDKCINGSPIFGRCVVIEDRGNGGWFVPRHVKGHAFNLMLRKGRARDIFLACDDNGIPTGASQVCRGFSNKNYGISRSFQCSLVIRCREGYTTAFEFIEFQLGDERGRCCLRLRLTGRGYWLFRPFGEVYTGYNGCQYCQKDQEQVRIAMHRGQSSFEFSVWSVCLRQCLQYLRRVILSGVLSLFLTVT